MAKAQTTGKEEAVKGGPAAVTAGLAKATGAAATLEESFARIKAGLAEMSDEWDRTAEARRRDAEQWDYEEGVRRRAKLAEQAAEDAERERKYAERELALRAGEAVVKEVVRELLGVDVATLDQKGTKGAQEALAKKLDAAEAKGKAIAEGAAKKERETEVKIAAAEAKAATDMLVADKARLEREVAELKAANALLAQQNQVLASRMGDLSKNAFEAAGGITSRANEALASAAQGANVGRSPR